MKPLNEYASLSAESAESNLAKVRPWEADEWALCLPTGEPLDFTRNPTEEQIRTANRAILIRDIEIDNARCADLPPCGMEDFG